MENKLQRSASKKTRLTREKEKRGTISANGRTNRGYLLVRRKEGRRQRQQKYPEKKL